MILLFWIRKFQLGINVMIQMTVCVRIWRSFALISEVLLENSVRLQGKAREWRCLTPTAGNESSHENSDGSGVRIVSRATPTTVISGVLVLTHWAVTWLQLSYQSHRDKQEIPFKVRVRYDLNRACCDGDNFLFGAAGRERLSVSEVKWWEVL